MLKFCLLRELLSCLLFSPQVSILEAISILNPDQASVVKFFKRFEYMGHARLAIEMPDRCLYNLLEERDWKPLSLSMIQPIAKQVYIAGIWKQLPIILQIYSSSMKKH